MTDFIQMFAEVTLLFILAIPVALVLFVVLLFVLSAIMEFSQSNLGKNLRDI